ncbi:MAG: T9SS type A sorting domain-containing protein [Balneola sp.]
MNSYSKLRAISKNIFNFQKLVFLSLLLLGTSDNLLAQTLPLPARSAQAISGSEFKNQIENLSLENREAEIYNQIIAGNVPDFLRELVPISISKTINDSVYNVTYFVTPDYMAIGSDSNYFLMPMTPILAQKLADSLSFTLPTKQMVDQIWSKATAKLSPSPIAASSEMTTIPVMWDHNITVKAQRAEQLSEEPLGALVAGHKKDVIISNRIYGNSSNRVVIYGWHYLSGTPIQPVYAGHGETYADYSHGIRLVRDSVVINNQSRLITEVLTDVEMASLFSDEGSIRKPYYPLAGDSELPPPKNISVISSDSTTAQVIIKENPEVNSYRVFLSSNGVFFSEFETFTTNSFEISGLEPNTVTYLKIQAISETEESDYSEVLAVVPNQLQNNILVINGFDRNPSGNTFDFIKEHGQALHDNEYSFDATSNDAIIDDQLSLEDYDIVLWILGTESTADETFNDTEQTKVKSFLQNGGSLFVSGAEIAWDLDNRGSTNDKAFFHNYLKAKYQLDAPNNQTATFYTTEPTAGSIFDGISSITFDNGTNGSYNVQYPDVLTPTNGSDASLIYSSVSSQQVAAIQFKGMFEDGNIPGKVVYLGFPFETIYPDTVRKEVMDRIMSFMGSEATSISDESIVTVDEFSLKQNYPNPFNPTTNINYTLANSSHVTLSIYNSTGQKVTTLVNSLKSKGSHSVTWNATQFASGMYFYRLNTPDGSTTRKMILIK